MNLIPSFGFNKINENENIDDKNKLNKNIEIDNLFNENILNNQETNNKS